MQHTTELSDAKRALLEKYLQGNIPQAAITVETIPPRSSKGFAPLSFGQRQLWFLARLMPDSPAYNESLTISFTGSLNVAALEQSLNEFISRHEIWRTSFPVIDGQPVQMVHPPSYRELAVLDLRSRFGPEREGEALRLATDEAIRPFDLAHGPLLRAMLVQLHNDEYRLFMTLHHIIFDAVSINHIFLPELHALYESFSHGQPSSLSSPPIQYADFAAWERESLHEDIFVRHLAYWKQQLAGSPPVLDLPTDRPRPPVQSYRGSMQTFVLPRHLTDALKTLSRQESVTLYMTLMAAFQALLHRYTGQDDLLLGTVTSTRKHPAVQHVVGYFLNTVVLRTDLSGNPTFRELLKRVRKVIMSARHHEDMPFDILVKELDPPRSLSYQPLIQVLLSYQPQLLTLPPGWTLSQMDIQTHTSKFDLTLELDDRPEGLIGRFIYNTDLFDASTISRMVGHWQTLLEGIIANPSQHLSELPLLTEKERHLLVDWNDTGSEYPQDQCIHQLFEEQVERTPEAVAVIFEQSRLTYRELNERANRLARTLQRLGVGPDVLVGLYMERSLEMVIGLLSILKAGGAYVPLDPALPKDRMAFMIEDTQTPLLLTQRRFAASFSSQETLVVCIDMDWEPIAHESTGNPISGTTAKNLAYAIYTSGSSGKPKAVMIEHQSVLNLLIGLNQSIYANYQGTKLRISLNGPLAFDTSVKQIIQLLNGHALYIVPEEIRLDGNAFLAYLRYHNLDVLDCTPSQLQILLAAGILEEPGTMLRIVLIGGEPVDERTWRILAGSRVDFYNVYGPTECTVDATVSSMRMAPGQPVIGRPIANMRIYILDAWQQLVPVGVPGEIYIGGAGLARGYLNRPELTAERFIPDPFSQTPGARLYKTGDVARYLPDGNIEFLGRSDSQVKIRGFRIELGEIEAVLRQHAKVREAVVVVREDAPGEKRLVGYVILEEKGAATGAELQKHVMKQLPNYMVLAAVVVLEAFPYTPNGKVDRRGLSVPHPSTLTQEETFVAPRLLIHHQLVQIWEGLLEMRPIGIRDNFFYIGGHSLLAARLVDRIEQVFGRRIALSTLFSGPTIEELAEALQRQANAGARTALLPVQVGGSKRPFFFLHGDWTGGAFYCFALARALGPDQPFYVLEPYKFGGLKAVPSLETVAAAHIESMRAIQPEGPYLLGGFCNGGLLAYEMARQLQAAGERVDLLALINPSQPVQLKSLRTVSNCIGKLLRLGTDKQANLFLRVRHVLRHVYRYLFPSSSRVQDFDQLLVIDPRLKAMFPPVEAYPSDYVGVFTWLVSRYETGIYAGKITFYWAREEPLIEKSWYAVTGAKDREDVENHVVAGTHMSCVTEHIQDLAGCLSTCVSRVQEEAVTPKNTSVKCS